MSGWPLICVLGTMIFPAMMSALQRLDARAHVVGNERAIVFVVDVADAVLGEAELVDAALEACRSCTRSIMSNTATSTPLTIDVSDAARRFVVLVGVDADGELVRLRAPPRTRRVRWSRTRGR